MTASDLNFTGSIPDVYDEFLVPLIFQPYAQDMANRVAARKPKTVLETAAGSGVVTRALAPLLPRDCIYTVTDLNPPMLDRAAHRQPADGRITWKQADASALPFEDQSFDALCCQFGVMFLPDKQLAFSEANRVLKKGGQFIFNVWDRIEENEFAHSVTKTAARLFSEDPPMFMARTPHGYYDVEAIEQELRVAGFESIEVHKITERSVADTPMIAATAYCAGTPLRNEIEDRIPGALEAVTAAAAADIETRFGAGPVSGKVQGFVFIALS